MLHLEIGNSLCSFKGATVTELRSLRNVCAYYVSTGQKVPCRLDKTTGRERFLRVPLQKMSALKKQGIKIYWKVLRDKRHLMSERGQFPTGLLYRVEAWMKKNGWDYGRTDKRVRPKLGSISSESLYLNPPPFEPYPEQVEAAEAAAKEGRGVVVGPTGVGKSTIAALICDALRVKTLIVVPTLALKYQLTEDLRSLFGAGRVGPLGKSDTPFYDISVENVAALNYRTKLKGIDCIIIDEFHHSGAATYRKLNLKSWSDVYFKIGMTATPFRSDDEERLLLESVLSKVIYRIEYQTAVDKGYIVPLEAYYIDLPLRADVPEDMNYAAAYSFYVVENEYRNDLIARFVANLADAQVAALVLTKHIAHGVALQDRLDKMGYFVPFAEGKNELKSDYIKAFNNLGTAQMIGTEGVLGEGVDTKPAEWAFLAGGGKSKNAFMQKAGRVFRKYKNKTSGKVVLFRDPNNRWMLEHFEMCVQYLKDEYGVVPAKIEID